MNLHNKIAREWYDNGTFSDKPDTYTFTKREVSQLIQEWEAMQSKLYIIKQFKELLDEQTATNKGN